MVLVSAPTHVLFNYRIVAASPEPVYIGRYDTSPDAAEFN